MITLDVNFDGITGTISVSDPYFLVKLRNALADASHYHEDEGRTATAKSLWEVRDMLNEKKGRDDYE